MKIQLGRVASSALLIAALAACAHQQPMPAPSPAHVPAQTTAPQPTQAPPVAIVAATSFASVEHYKQAAAEHIMRFNADHTFSGKLPRMLPAVVVLSITVDESGAMTEVMVQRPPAQDDGESEIALASMRRSGVLPRPHNLVKWPRRTLVYSETFLFNADMRFQLRTLAPVQTAD
jgi:protein TonB